MKEKFRIRVVLRKDKMNVNQKCPIYYILTLNKKEYKLSTGHWLEVDNWDYKKKTPKSKFPNLKRKIDHDIQKLEDFFFERSSRELPVTIEIIKDFYNGKNHVDFFDYYKRFLELKKTTERLSTIKSYIGTLNHLKRYKTHILINEIDTKFIRDFDHYLRVTCQMGNGGAWARHKNLKTVINALVADEYLTKSPYGKGKFEVKRTTSETTYLNDYELDQLKSCREELSPEMQVNLDRFLFSCYTGLRYSDVVSLTWNDIVKGKMIKKKMVKTNKFVLVPLHKAAKELILRYKGNDEVLVFPRISNDKLNKALRKIKQVAGIDKRITSHVGRHTFGYILGKEGVNAFKIMEFMGHSNVKQTSRYVQTNEEDLTAVMNGIKSFSSAS